jgi:LPXTG-motif cell wall-anchored protein
MCYMVWLWENSEHMKRFKSIALVTFAGCITLGLSAGLHADEWNKKTALTVSEPIQVPSCCTASHTVTLQPGEYVIKLMESLSDRHIVQVYDKDEHTVITTILAIPNYRLKPTGNTVFQYWEVPAGEPKAVRAWFYPGDNFGQEFAYTAQTASGIAAIAKTQVPAIEKDTVAVEDLKTVPVVSVDENGKSSELVATAPEPVATPEPAPVAEQPVQTADRAEPAPVETAEVQPAELPHTASSMPLFGLIGLLSLLAFGALSVRSRRAQ